jgi:hypothetical protein
VSDGWVVAERKCVTEGLAKQNYGGDVGKCKQVLADDYAYFGCAMRLCPPPPPVRPTSSGGWTWKNTTPNASVKLFQEHLNVAMARAGYKPIVADGRLGPATCGAFNFVRQEDLQLFANDPIQNIGICQAFTNPTRVGSSSPEKNPTSPEGKALDEKYAGLPWMKPDPRVPALQAEINRQLTSHDYEPIPVSGMLDPPTCGAMHELDEVAGMRWVASWGPIQMADCPSIIRPRKKAVAQIPIVVAVPTPGTPAPAPSDPTATATGLSAGALLGGSLLAAAMVGGYVWWKKKTGGA